MVEPRQIDVLIIGAGLSGIGMAHHLQRLSPGTTYVILEGRQRIGGTWDLFRYPGIRSDSDMHTLGYRFRPWLDTNIIADGASIRDYIEDTAREAGIDRHIRFGTKVVAADWSSERARWRVTTDGGSIYECRFLIACAGYYSHAEGHRPAFPDEAAFRGRIILPQDWPEDLDWTGKRVAVIGSGATAVTLIPSLAKDAAKVTMVQRSPSYVAAMPRHDGFGATLRRFLPARTAARIARRKTILLTMALYRYARWRPEAFRKLLAKDVRRRLGDGAARHFEPSYNPWDQRLCLDPDGAFFDAIAAGKAAVATGTIQRFTPGGILMDDGSAVAADIIVTATGLQLASIGGTAISLDGAPVNFAETMAYKGLMFSGVPNFASIFGYTNASWTLKADLAAAWLCRIINRMNRRGEAVVMAPPDPDMPKRRFVDFTATYIERALPMLPSQGERGPWRLRQNYLVDVVRLRFGRLDDGVLTFRRALERPRRPD